MQVIKIYPATFYLTFYLCHFLSITSNVVVPKVLLRRREPAGAGGFQHCDLKSQITSLRLVFGFYSRRRPFYLMLVELILGTHA